MSDGSVLHFIEAGKGAPLILMHGGMGDMLSWAPQLEVFSRYFRTFSYSRRYSHPNNNALRALSDPAGMDAGDLAEIMGTWEVDCAHLVGTSYGALVALTFALKWPDKVLSLVLAEPPLHAWVKEMCGGKRVHDRFMRHVWKPAGASFHDGRSRDAMTILAEAFGMQGAHADSELVASLMRNVRAMKALVLSADPFSRVESHAVHDLRIPTLIVRGEASDEIHRIGTFELARLMRSSQTAVIPASGHQSPSQNPAAFNTVVLSFLRRVCADAGELGFSAQ